MYVFFRRITYHELVCSIEKPVPGGSVPFFNTTKREKAHTLGERYTPLRKKNVMYVIGEVRLLPRLLFWNFHRILIVEASFAQWKIAHH